MSVLLDDNWQDTGMYMRDWVRLPMREKLRRILSERSNKQYGVLSAALAAIRSGVE